MADDGIPDKSGLGFDAVFLAIPVDCRLLFFVKKNRFAKRTAQLDLPVAHSVNRNGILFLSGRFLPGHNCGYLSL